MKRLLIAVIAILVLVALAAIGCTNKGLVGTPPEEGEEVVSSCVSCHTDKETLKALASSEPEAATSEATTGEG